MKKKKPGSAGLVAAVVFVVIAGAVVGVSQDWASGHNRIIDYVGAYFGDAQAQYAMGRKLQEAGRSDGVIRAQEWYQRAADKGHVPAMIALGDFFSDKDDEPSGEQAVSWYKKAADAGNGEALRKLGGCYETGRGKLKVDAQKAFELYGLAARKGDVEAEYLYGQKLYMKAQFDEAILWLGRAADHGNSNADYELGKLFADGWMPEDPQKSVFHLRRAAEAGNWKGQLLLGYKYIDGSGVTKDLSEAYKWILLACDSNAFDAKSARNLFERRLSPEQKAEGVKRAAAWRVARKH
jgi:uncharacterized protein